MDRSRTQQDLDRLVREHLPAALRFATRLTGRADTAEDLLQEGLLRAARGWKTFRGESEFRTWLFRIVINVFRDRLSSPPKTTVVLPPEVADARPTDPSSEAQGAELGHLIAARVSSLPARQREVLVLIAFEGVSPREVAGMLDITEANVHSTLRVARERLRRELAPYFVQH